MTNLINGLLFAARLMTATSPATAEEICATEWAPGGDGHVACVLGLETWRCARQGWCDADETAPYEGAVELPDPVWAGQQEWE